MAMFRFKVKVGKKINHLKYINREDKYKSKKDLIKKEIKNLPKDFIDDKEFWETSLKYERRNANIYREFEISLPKEYSDEKNIEIFEKFLEDVFKEEYVYNYAYHRPEDNPHVHVMFCEREIKDKNKTKENFFKRYNPKNPDISGHKKNDKWQKKETLIKLRLKWENHLNEYLIESNLEPVSSKTLKEQREEKISKGDIVGAEILNRKPINFELLNPNNKNYEKDKKDYYMLKQKNKEEAKIYKNYIKEKQVEKYKRNRKYFSKKTIKETLEALNKKESFLFSYQKKALEKNLESFALNELSEGKTNQLKNNLRSEFKKIKELKNELKENKKIKKNQKKILKKEIMETKENIEKIKEELEELTNTFSQEEINKVKLQRKQEVIEKTKEIFLEREIIYSIFREKFKEKKILTNEEKEIYDIYIKNKDLHKQKLLELEKNKVEIKENLERKNYTDAKILQLQNDIIRSFLNRLQRININYNRSKKIDKEMSKYNEFVLVDFKDYEQEMEKER